MRKAEFHLSLYGEDYDDAKTIQKQQVSLLIKLVPSDLCLDTSDLTNQAGRLKKNTSTHKYSNPCMMAAFLYLLQGWLQCFSSVSHLIKSPCGRAVRYKKLKRQVALCSCRQGQQLFCIPQYLFHPVWDKTWMENGNTNFSGLCWLPPLTAPSQFLIILMPVTWNNPSQRCA